MTANNVLQWRVRFLLGRLLILGSLKAQYLARYCFSYLLMIWGFVCLIVLVCICMQTMPIQSEQDCLDLQSDLLQLDSWSKTWLLEFNPIKCKVMSVCRNIKFEFPYKLCNVFLEKNFRIQ